MADEQIVIQIDADASKVHAELDALERRAAKPLKVSLEVDKKALDAANAEPAQPSAAQPSAAEQPAAPPVATSAGPAPLKPAAVAPPAVSPRPLDPAPQIGTDPALTATAIELARRQRERIEAERVAALTPQAQQPPRLPPPPPPVVSSASPPPPSGDEPVGGPPADARLTTMRRNVAEVRGLLEQAQDAGQTSRVKSLRETYDFLAAGLRPLDPDNPLLEPPGASAQRRQAGTKPSREATPDDAGKTPAERVLRPTPLAHDEGGRDREASATSGTQAEGSAREKLVASLDREAEAHDRAARQTSRQSDAAAAVDRRAEKLAFEAGVAGLRPEEQLQAIRERRRQFRDRGGVAAGEGGFPVGPDAEDDLRLAARENRLERGGKAGIRERIERNLPGQGTVFSALFGFLEAVPALRAGEKARRVRETGGTPEEQYDAEIAAVDASSAGLYGSTIEFFRDPLGKDKAAAEEIRVSATRADTLTETRKAFAAFRQGNDESSTLLTLQGRERALKDVDFKADADQKRIQAEAAAKLAAELGRHPPDPSGEAHRAGRRDPGGEGCEHARRERTQRPDHPTRPKRSGGAGDAGNDSERRHSGREGCSGEGGGPIGEGRRQAGGRLRHGTCPHQSRGGGAGERAAGRSSAGSQLRSLGLTFAAGIAEAEAGDALEVATARSTLNDADFAGAERSVSARADERKAVQFRGGLNALYDLNTDQRSALAELAGDERQGRVAQIRRQRDQQVEGVRSRFEGFGPFAELLTKGVNALAGQREELVSRTYDAREQVLLGNASGDLIAASGYDIAGTRARIGASREALQTRYGGAQPAERRAEELRLQAAEPQREPDRVDAPPSPRRRGGAVEVRQRRQRCRRAGVGHQDGHARPAVAGGQRRGARPYRGEWPAAVEAPRQECGASFRGRGRWQPVRDRQRRGVPGHYTRRVRLTTSARRSRRRWRSSSRWRKSNGRTWSRSGCRRHRPLIRLPARRKTGPVELAATSTRMPSPARSKTCSGRWSKRFRTSTPASRPNRAIRKRPVPVPLVGQRRSGGTGKVRHAPARPRRRPRPSLAMRAGTNPAADLQTR